MVFASTWIAKNSLTNVELIPASYSEKIILPDIKDKVVFLIDFVYEKKIIDYISKCAKFLIILDHHLTTNVEFKDYLNFKNLNYSQLKIILNSKDLNLNNKSNVITLIDLKRSAAKITWDFFNPNKKTPKLIEFIQDKDLGKLSLDKSAEINAYLYSYPYDFDIFDQLMQKNIDSLIEHGESILRKQNKEINELLGQLKRRIKIAGYNVWAVNSTYTLGPELLSSLLDNEPFAVYYYDTPEFRIFGLRSNEKGLNVSDIAKLFKGGGHSHSAGFKVKRNHQLAKI